MVLRLCPLLFRAPFPGLVNVRVKLDGCSQEKHQNRAETCVVPTMPFLMLRITNAQIVASCGVRTMCARCGYYDGREVISLGGAGLSFLLPNVRLHDSEVIL